MNIRSFFTTFPILALICACQTEVPQENIEPKRVLTVRATLPGSDDTRAHITYGNPDINKELFRWDMEDEIVVFNSSKISECPYGIKLATSKINDNYAEFESSQDDSSFHIEAGDVLFIAYYDARTNPFNDSHIFTIDVASQSNKPQYIVSDPDGNMSYMKHNLKMYDIVTAIENDKIPDVHFRHLSAILRVSLRNETGHDMFLTSLEFKYPGTESFFNTTLYCFVDNDPSNESGLNVYTGEKFFTNTSKPYTDNISSTINGKIGTADAGGSIKNGETYDLYISTVPRIGNNIKGEKGLNISLVEAHKTGDTDSYSIDIKEFDVAIQAGKRYWFNLTAVEEDGTRKLVFTSDWLKAHPDAEPYYK